MTNEHQDGEREYHAILKDAYWVNDFRSPNIGGHIQGDTKGRFENGEWVSTSTVFEHLGDDIYRTRYSVYKVEWRDDRGEPSEPISGYTYTYTRARLDKAAVEPVPVDAGEVLRDIKSRIHAERYECTPLTIDDASTDAEKELMCIIDYIDAEVTAALASMPARRGVSEWRPLSEAPKIHGKQWLGWDADVGRYVMEWFTDKWVYSWNQEPCPATMYAPLPPTPSEAV